MSGNALAEQQAYMENNSGHAFSQQRAVACSQTSSGLELVVCLRARPKSSIQGLSHSHTGIDAVIVGLDQKRLQLHLRLVFANA